MTPITTIKKKDRLYYARIIPKTGIYEVCEITLAERKDALEKVKTAEKNKIKISEETDYEEY